MDRTRLEANGPGAAPGLLSSCQGGPQPSPPEHFLLLDLPPELLFEGLRDAPHSLRSTCSAFRDALDSTCTSLRVPHPASSPRRLKDLTALLRRLPHLRFLDSGGHDFKTLPLLAACPALQSLALTNATLAAHQLRALSSCPHLTSLNLSGCCPLLSISAVSSLTALRTLNLRGCETLSSLSPLEHCPQLASLNLNRGRWGWMDLGPLTALRSLQHLHIFKHARGDVAAGLDIAPLAGCTALLSLDLADHTVADLVPLSGCSLLQILYVRCDESATSIAPLAACAASLTYLNLNGSGFASIDPLSTFASLTSLTLDGLTQVTGIQALSSCSSLTTLRLLDFPSLSDLAPLSALGRTLTTLCLIGCRVSDIAPVGACVLLTTLHLACTLVRTYMPLVSCSQLVLLRVDKQKEEDPSLWVNDLAALQAACGTRLQIQHTF